MLIDQIRVVSVSFSSIKMTRYFCCQNFYGDKNLNFLCGDLYGFIKWNKGTYFEVIKWQMGKVI